MRAGEVRSNIGMTVRSWTLLSPVRRSGCASGRRRVRVNGIDDVQRGDRAARRVVVRRGLTMDVADMLLDDLRKKVKHFEKLRAPVYGKDPGGFHH